MYIAFLNVDFQAYKILHHQLTYGPIIRKFMHILPIVFIHSLSVKLTGAQFLPSWVTKQDQKRQLISPLPDSSERNVKN